MTTTIAAVLSAIVPILVAAGAALRYLVQILATVQRSIALAEQIGERLDRHLEQSAAVHAALAQRTLTPPVPAPTPAPAPAVPIPPAPAPAS